jgi:uncharacterized membrane protein
LKAVKKHVTAGIILVLPLTLTLLIIGILVHWLTTPFIGITEKILIAAGLHESPILFMSPDTVLLHFSQLFVIGFLFIVIFILGCLGRHFFFRTVLTCGNALLHKIPLIGSVYKTCQDFFNALPSSNATSFKQVVLVPFPHRQCYSIGFVTQEGSIPPHLIPVFVPAAPNLIHGYALVFSRAEVIPINISVEEAFRCILSCGALLPHAAISSSNEITEVSVS